MELSDGVVRSRDEGHSLRQEWAGKSPRIALLGVGHERHFRIHFIGNIGNTRRDINRMLTEAQSLRPELQSAGCGKV